MYKGNYLSAFKKLEHKLRKISGVRDESNIYDVLSKAENFNYLVKTKRQVILDLNALRNVFAHSDREKYIAEVNKIAFDEINQILKLLENPPVIGETFKKSVYYVGPNDFTHVVIGEMRRKIYTHVPVYDKNKFLGVFSETTLLYWLSDNIREGKATFFKKQIKDVKREYLFPSSDIKKILPSKTSIFEIPKLFNDAISTNNRLGAIIITESGNKNELPIGIITAWDLPVVDNYIRKYS